METNPKEINEFSKFISTTESIIKIIGWIFTPAVISVLLAAKGLLNKNITLPLWVLINVPFILGFLIWIINRIYKYKTLKRPFIKGDRVQVKGFYPTYLVDGYSFFKLGKVICQDFSTKPMKTYMISIELLETETPRHPRISKPRLSIW